MTAPKRDQVCAKFAIAAHEVSTEGAVAITRAVQHMVFAVTKHARTRGVTLDWSTMKLDFVPDQGGFRGRLAIWVDVPP